jgi:hypothetical protein
MLDRFIKRWSGVTLIGLGVIAIGLAVAGYYRLLPPPFSLPARLDDVIGPTRLTFTAQVLALLGLLLMAWGAALIRHFRREREVGPFAA